MQMNLYVFLAFIGISATARCRIVGPDNEWRRIVAEGGNDDDE